MGKALVRVPFYSMVNLVAGTQMVPELIQDQMTAEKSGSRSSGAARKCGRAGRDAPRPGRGAARWLSGTRIPMEKRRRSVEEHLCRGSILDMK